MNFTVPWSERQVLDRGQYAHNAKVYKRKKIFFFSRNIHWRKKCIDMNPSTKIVKVMVPLLGTQALVQGQYCNTVKIYIVLESIQNL